MHRERALRVVLVVVGLIFCGLAYPLIMFVKQEPALTMQFSVYVTLGSCCSLHPVTHQRIGA